jgi:hypothetical protein
MIDQCNYFLHENLQLCMIYTGKVFYHCTKTRIENCKFWQWGGQVKWNFIHGYMCRKEFNGCLELVDSDAYTELIGTHSRRQSPSPPPTKKIPPASRAGRYDNPIPTQFLAPIDCSKIPALSPYL